MKFKLITEIIPEGLHIYKVENAVEGVSKKNNNMITLDLKISGEIIKDYLLEASKRKFIHFLRTHNIDPKGDIPTAQLIGLKGFCEIGIEPPVQYLNEKGEERISPEKNFIKDYIVELTEEQKIEIEEYEDIPF